MLVSYLPASLRFLRRQLQKLVSPLCEDYHVLHDVDRSCEDVLVPAVLSYRRRVGRHVRVYLPAALETGFLNCVRTIMYVMWTALMNQAVPCVVLFLSPL